MKAITIRVDEKQLKRIKIMARSKTNQAAFEWLIESAIKADRIKQNKELKERIKRLSK